MAKPKVPMAQIESAPKPAADEQERTVAQPAAEPARPQAAPKQAQAKAAKPKMKIADEPEPQPEPESEQTHETAPAGDAQASSIAELARSQSKQLLAEHFHAVVGGLCGLVAALLIFVIGFWQTLFVSLLVFVGVALGQYLDGDPKIVNLIRQFLSEGRGNN